MPQRKRKAAPAGSPLDRAIDAALRLAARQGWARTTLAEIAAEAGLSLAELHGLVAGKGAILDAFARRVDRVVLVGTPASLATEPPRDRLFDVLMRRLDALGPHKDSLRAILGSCAADPFGITWGACRLARSMRWMLEAAGIPATGCRGRLRVKALSVGYACVLRVWLRDDSQDLAKTMAALDRLLRRGEAVEQTVSGLGRHRPPAEPAAA
jgi:AcrR family transcriptional regulator